MTIDWPSLYHWFAGKMGFQLVEDLWVGYLFRKLLVVIDS